MQIIHVLVILYIYINIYMPNMHSNKDPAAHSILPRRPVLYARGGWVGGLWVAPHIHRPSGAHFFCLHSEIDGNVYIYMECVITRNASSTYYYVYTNGVMR